jgi:hypothetical protein
MEIQPSSRKGYRLTVNPNTKRVTFKCPQRSSKDDTDYKEIILFAKSVAKQVLEESKTTLRGKLYITSGMFRVTMYSHDKANKITISTLRGL